MINNIEYNKLILDKMDDFDTTSNYVKTVGRELKIFKSYEQKKLYVDFKTSSIMIDYCIKEPLNWRKKNNGLIKNYKKGIFLSEYNLHYEYDKFLTDIPYFLALHYEKIMKNQNLVDFSFLDWLAFFNYQFFKNDVYLKNKKKITRILDTALTLELKNNRIFKSFKEDDIIYFKENSIMAFKTKEENNLYYFYICFGDRHHLFEIKDIN